MQLLPGGCPAGRPPVTRRHPHAALHALTISATTRIRSMSPVLDSSSLIPRINFGADLVLVPATDPRLPDDRAPGLPETHVAVQRRPTHVAVSFSAADIKAAV